MLLAQAQRIPGFHVVGVADLDVGKRAPRSPASAGRPSATAPQAWATPSRPARPASLTMRVRSPHATRSNASSKRPVILSRVSGMRSQPSTAASTSSWSMSKPTCSAACLAARARAKNLVYSMAYGDQPAIICELVDWVRSCGFELTSARDEFRAALPYHAGHGLELFRLDGGRGRQGRLQPENVQLVYGRDQGGDRDGGGRQRDGLDCRRRPCVPTDRSSRLAGVFKPVSDGGRLPRSGLSISRPARSRTAAKFNNIRYGVFVTFKANNEYTRDCFKQYGCSSTSPAGTGRCGGPFT